MITGETAGMAIFYTGLGVLVVVAFWDKIKATVRDLGETGLFDVGDLF